MTAMPWIKLYREARTDRKLDALSDAEFRTWFNLLLFSAEQDQRGAFCDVGTLALEVARGDQEALDATIAKLESLRILEQVADGSRIFRAFEARQMPRRSDTPEATRERQAKHRALVAAGERPSEAAVSSDMSRDVTRDSHEEGEGDTDEEEDKSVQGDTHTPEPQVRQGEIGEVSRAFERLTGKTPPNLLSLCADYPTALTVEAIRKAADSGHVPTASFIRSIAQRLVSEGWTEPPTITHTPSPYAGL